MKKLKSFSFLLLSSLIFISCSSSKKFASGNETLALEKQASDFVQMLNGNIVKTKKIISSGFTGKKEVKTSDGGIYSWKELVAFKNDKGYFAKYTRNDDLSETGYFIARVIKGNINVYKNREVSNQTGADGRSTNVNVYYIQKGNGTRIYELTAGNLKPLVKDYELAYNLVAKLANYSNNNKKLEDAILSYNSKP